MYVCGLVIPVPEDRMDAYRAWAESGAAFFREYGCLEIVECWEDFVPDGKTTDFNRAVDAQKGETVVFGWVEWPDKATRDTGMGALMESAEMRDNPPPWNGPTAIFGGFVPILDSKL